MVAEKTYTDYRSTDIRTGLRYVVELTSIGIIYVALAKLSLALAFHSSECDANMAANRSHVIASHSIPGVRVRRSEVGAPSSV